MAADLSGRCVMFTAQLTGGFGFRALGSDVYGGEKIPLCAGGHCDLFRIHRAAHSAPKCQVLCIAFLLGGGHGLCRRFGSHNAVGLKFIYLVFPPSIYMSDTFEVGVTRLGGVGGAAGAIYVGCWPCTGFGAFCLAANSGGRSCLPAFALSFLGGFRTMLLGTFSSSACFFSWRDCTGQGCCWFSCWWERSERSLSFRWPPFAVHRPTGTGVIAIGCKSGGQDVGRGSTQWRIDMWKALLH